jgi:uncharacterized membrane protein
MFGKTADVTWRLIGLGALVGIEFILLTVPSIPYRFFWAFTIMAGATGVMVWMEIWLWVVILGFGSLLISMAKIDNWRASRS